MITPANAAAGAVASDGIATDRATLEEATSAAGADGVVDDRSGRHDTTIPAGESVERTRPREAEAIPGDANVSRTSVTLVTGQTVTVLEFANETRYRVDADVPMQQVETPKGTYVFPAGTDFGTVDRALFNVDLLVEQGLTDEASDSIPIIVAQRSSPSRTFDPLDTGANGSLQGVSASFAQEVRRTRGVRTERLLGSVGALSADVAKADAGAAFERLSEDPSVKRVYLDRRVRVTLDDVEAVVGAKDARTRFDVSGDGVTVAVLDTGVDDTHPDIQGSVVVEKDFTGEGTTADGHGHGTHVAGIITGDGSASDGQYVGMAPDADIMNLRVIGSDGYGSTSDIIDAMEYAETNGADVISMSLGGDTGSNDPFFDAVQQVTASGTAVVAAAGNSGPSYETIKSPGVVPEAITVGASDDYDGITSFSSRGPTPLREYVKPDLVAPGSYVYSAQAGTDGYVAKSGTSMATPVVSGVAALVLQEHPDWGPQQLKSALVTTSDALGKDVYTAGAGRLNATAAVDASLLVTGATTNVGELSDGTTATETLRVTNVGSESRTVDVSATATSLDGDVGHVSVNRTTVTVAPGETVAVGLDVTGDTPNGVYSGRVQFDGGDLTAIFGYRVSGLSSLTVEKRAVNATDVGGDGVYLVGHDSGGTELDSLSATDTTGDTATAAFPVADGTYTVYTAGVDESTGQPVIMAETVTVSGDATVTLEESATVRYRLDASEARSADGSLATLELVGRLGTAVNGDPVHYQFRQSFAGTTTVRFSETAEQTASVAHLLAPEDRYPNGDRHLDTPVAYHVLHSTAGIDGSETFVLDRSALARQSVTYYRSSDGQTYDVAREITSDDVTGEIATGEWSIRDRADQTVYVSPTGTDGVESRVSATASDDSWAYAGTDWLSIDGGNELPLGINEPPLTGTASATVGRFDVSSNVTMLVTPRVEQGETRDVRSSTAETDYTVSRDGSVLESGTTTQNPVYFTDDQALPDGTVYELVTESPSTGQPLSTTTRNELQVTYRAGDDNDPPLVEGVSTGAVAVNGTVPAGEVTLEVDVADNRLSEVTVLVRVSSGAVTATPYDGAITDTSTEWQDANVSVVDRSAGTYRATVDTSPFANDTMNLEVAVVDAGGNGVSSAAYDAYRVGGTVTDEPPTASITTSPSSPAVNESIGFYATESSDDDAIASYEWAFGDGATATGETAVHAYDAPGEYPVTLTVTDTAGQTDTATTTVSVEDRTDPSADLAANRTTVGVDDVVELDASGSTDNVAVAEYRWDLDGDGSVDRTTTASAIDVAFGSVGTYPATVTVVDEAGNADAASVSIAVEDRTAPTATVDANATSVEVGDTVAFDGSASSDNVGIVSHEWAFGDGATASGETVSHAFASEGTYTVTLTVTDGAGNTDTATVTVDVTADSAPTAAFEATATSVALAESVGFDASASSDDDAIASYEWAFGDGATATGETVSHAYDVPGEYAVTLTVTDTAGQTDTATTTVTAEDRTAPAAALSANRTTLGIEDAVELDASGSTDNVAVAEYRWDLDGDGSVDRTTSTPTITHAYAATGTYQATATVVDEAGNADAASVSIAVEDRTAPSAEIAAGATSVEVGETVSVDGSGSNDNVGIVSYEWTFDDGTTASGETASHAYDSEGTYTVTLTVSDAAGNTDTATVDVDVTTDSAPTAAFETTATTVAIAESIGFDASASSDDDAIASYEWAFGDGATATGEQASHAYDAPGEYAVTLTVTDTADQTDTASTSVTVEDRTAPTATIDANATGVEVGDIIAFDGSGSSDNVGVESLEWDFGDGATASGEQVAHAYDSEGTYTVTLTATDAAGNTDTATVEVSVTEPAPDAAPSATLVAEPEKVEKGAPVELDASGSTDDDGIVEYRWDLDGDGAVDRVMTTPVLATVYDDNGAIRPSVTVVDTGGQTDTASVKINVVGNGRPSAKARLEAKTTHPGEAITFDASRSSDNGRIVSYEWTFGDGATATGRTVTHAYAETGPYSVTLTVTDAAGNTDTMLLRVSVQPQPEDRAGNDDRSDEKGTDSSDVRPHPGGVGSGPTAPPR